MLLAVHSNTRVIFNSNCIRRQVVLFYTIRNSCKKCIDFRLFPIFKNSKEFITAISTYKAKGQRSRRKNRGKIFQQYVTSRMVI